MDAIMGMRLMDKNMGPERVQVYWNLHKRIWSVRSKTTRLVLFHAINLSLGSLKFHVSKAGNARVRREKSKNIHAWIEGDLFWWDTKKNNYRQQNSDMKRWSQGNMLRVYYNPYKVDRFHLQTFDEHLMDAEVDGLAVARFYEGGSVWIDQGEL